MALQAVLFDTFGTVVDWRTGIAAAVAELTGTVDPLAFADAWRARYQPSMEPIRAGRRPFVRLTDLHRENLAATLAEFGWQPPDTEHLNRAWERLPPWADSVEGLRDIKRHRLIGPLSNGDTALLVRMARHAGLPWDVVLGSDVTRRYKPDPEAYTRMIALLDLPPSAVMLVAAHNDDLAAARAAGLATGFVPRPTEHGPGRTGDLTATADWDVVAADLVELAARLQENSAL
ncbi:MAG TPA: haloacid dehalogenase type II [Mycobacteriales bacterium]